MSVSSRAASRPSPLKNLLQNVPGVLLAPVPLALAGAAALLAMSMQHTSRQGAATHGRAFVGLFGLFVH